MTLTIFGATGMVGRRIVRLALTKGYIVKAFGRNVESLIDEDVSNNNLMAIKGSVFDDKDVSDAVKGSDIILSVLGGALDGNDKTRSLGMKKIAEQMTANNVRRIVALGGLGILNAEDETLLMDNPAYPVEYVAVGNEHLKAYQFLTASNLDWTFVCAPNIVDEEGMGQYHTSANYAPVPNHGTITAGDLAQFMLSEAEMKRYLKQKAGISN